MKINRPNTISALSIFFQASEMAEAAKRIAAIRAVDEHIRSGMIVGIGSGSTVVYAARHLASLVSSGTLKDIICVPTSFQAQQLITEGNMQLSDLNRHHDIDICIDGADEVDEKLNLIKGGGGCQTQEKLVASAFVLCLSRLSDDSKNISSVSRSKKLVIICDYRKDSRKLGQQWKQGVPIEVLSQAYVLVSKRLQELGGKPQLRMAARKAGPVVTDNGNFIIDCDFGEIDDPKSLHDSIKSICGVVETGLFPLMAEMAYFGQEDGSVTARSR